MDPQTLRKEVCVIVPCYNAGPRLFPVVQSIRAVVENILVVDDGSTDGAPQECAGLAEIIGFPTNRGKGHALMEGFRHILEKTDWTYAAVLDADGQHDPSELPHLLQSAFDHEADLIIGARAFVGPDVPIVSRIGNVLTIWMAGLLLGRRINDTQSGFRLHSRRLLEDIVEHAAPGRYETEMEILVLAACQGYAIHEEPIRTIYERGNPSSHFDRIGDSWRVWRRLFQARLRHARRNRESTS
jgi:glycosyltransferase involved in cell wall biosynthesis